MHGRRKRKIDNLDKTSYNTKNIDLWRRFSMDFEKDKKMTKLSKMAFSKATMEINSAEDAVNFLRNDLITRSVRSIIEKFVKGQDMKTVQRILVAGLLENHADMKKEAVERRVRGWLNQKSTHTLKKEDAIEIAFILQLGIEEADEFVALISEEKLHWRSVEEIIYIYGLENGLSYKECADILGQPEIQNIVTLVEDCKTVEEIDEDGFTEFVKNDVEELHSVEELNIYLRENYGKLGYFHNTAYDIFMEMLGKLESPSQMEEELHLFDDDDVLDKYTIRDIMEEFLYKDIVLTAKQKAVKAKKNAKKQLVSKEKQYVLDIIQKKVSDSWPDEVSISKMKNRKMDVTRKMLILLFLATDGDYNEGSYDYDLTEEEVFEDVYERLNDMLFFCGYSALDPRNPFDWLIIYCIHVQDLFDIDPKMQSLLEELFPNSDEDKDS